MDEMLYFHLALEPHLKHSGLGTGRRILFLAEVSVDAAKKTGINPGDEHALRQEAEHLAAELLPIAMTGRPAEEGEDVMRLTCQALPKPPESLLEHSADAEEDGVRLWLLGSNVD